MCVRGFEPPPGTPDHVLSVAPIPFGYTHIVSMAGLEPATGFRLPASLALCLYQFDHTDKIKREYHCGIPRPGSTDRILLIKTPLTH